ncbi:MAG: hypothetical protein V1720_19950 [bacterium]
MKKLGLLFIAAILLISCSSTVEVKKESIKRTGTKENNGRYITAYGKLNALFLFIQFDDDSTTKSDGWPYDTTRFPSWASGFVNDENSNDYSNKNLSQYFHEMSFGNFEFCGYVYPKLVRPKFEQAHYKSIAEVNSEVLLALDGEIDFSKFDNWKYVKVKQFENTPDGTVDMIFLIYRNFTDRLFFNNRWTGSAELYLLKDIKTNDGVTIKRGQMKSGLQMRGGIHGFEYSKYVAAHEFGHFLFGAMHIEGLTNLCLMAGGPVWNAARGMVSWEKEQLGWISYTDVDTTRDVVYRLGDFQTTGQVLRINTSPDEYFMIENRDKKSIHDWAGDKGVYIYHYQRIISLAPKIDVMCADGNWQFEPDKNDMTLHKTIPDRGGRNELNYSHYFGKTNFTCSAPLYEDNSAWGDEYDAFDETYNNVFSPVSNPSSTNNAKKQFSIEVLENNGGIYKLKIFFNDVFGGKPSKPQGLSVKISDDSIPQLEWYHNEEPDLAGYRIYRIAGDKNSGYKKQIGLVKKGQFSASKKIIWFDKDFGKNREKNVFFYTVTAFDDSGNESVLSEIIPL